MAAVTRDPEGYAPIAIIALGLFSLLFISLLFIIAHCTSDAIDHRACRRHGGMVEHYKSMDHEEWRCVQPQVERAP